MVECGCTRDHPVHRVVLTGGPGAGKTALLELVRQSFCRHVHVLAESAGVVFGGGFPREDDLVSRAAAQRAIFHVQRELEVVGDTRNPAIVLCDRGTVDGAAYWPGDLDEFWSSLGTTREQELARYDAVIHLRTPEEAQGYNQDNPLRTETAAEASAIDARILEAWDGHPRRFVIRAEWHFLHKAAHALELLQAELPACCAAHRPLPRTGRDPE
jgi:predicted ATPase